MRDALDFCDTRVLITGGLGFIGAHLAREIVARGGDVTLLDSAPLAGSVAERLGIRRVRSVQIVVGDASAPETYESLGEDYTHVVHAAGVLGIETVQRQPILTLATNIGGAAACLGFAARQRRLERFLFTSTSEVYGQSAEDATEDQKLNVGVDSLRWGYATSKIAGEFYVRAYGAERGVPWVIVRPFNVYGASRLGPNAMSKLVGQALSDEPLVLTGNGEQSRAWCHIDDFVMGLLRCLRNDRALGRIFNIGNDRAFTTMRELAETIVRMTGSASEIVVRSDDVPDVQARRPDIELARNLLGYEPKVTLEDGLRDFITVADVPPRRTGAVSAPMSVG